MEPRSLTRQVPPTHMGTSPYRDPTGTDPHPLLGIPKDMFKLVHYVARTSLGKWALGIQMKCLLVPKWFNCHVICLHVRYSTNVADGNEEVPKKWTEKLHGKSIEDVDLMLLSPSLRCVECNTVTFLTTRKRSLGKVNALLAPVIVFTGEESPSGDRRPYTETPLDRYSLDKVPLRETPWTETTL